VTDLVCRVCRATATVPAGVVKGRLGGGDFRLAHCTECHFSFVIQPRTDYETLYSAEYYQGQGADPHVDYVFELEHPETTVRRYEWQGLYRAVAALHPLDGRTRWLDFGCGNGGLVRWARARGLAEVHGFETGWIADRARARGVPLLTEDELASHANTFDVITAIEVLEHIVEPVDALKQIARLLKPGGLLFVTTGNARPFRGRLAGWRYVNPEVHVSFFEPETLARAMRMAGFDPTYPGFVDGFDQIIRFKVLKALGVRKRALWERAVPWQWVARIVDARLAITAHPAGRRSGDPAAEASC